MKERPILFSAPMVRAILSGRKTQTRRVVKPQPVERGGESISISYAAGKMAVGPRDFMLKKLAQYGCPYGGPGDRFWVREAHAMVGNVDPPFVLYRASGYESECARHGFTAPPPESEVRWSPSIHMPRRASRITLEITSVRVERLQAITDADALAEGIEEYVGRQYVGKGPPADGRLRFSELWTSINGPDTWKANPWVWVVGFEVVKNG